VGRAEIESTFNMLIDIINVIYALGLTDRPLISVSNQRPVNFGKGKHMKKVEVLVFLLLFVSIEAQIPFKRVFPFSKDAARVQLIWNRIPEAKIEYWIYKWLYSNPSLGWVTLSTSDTTYDMLHASLGDSALICVAAKDSVGNLGQKSDTVKVAFRAAAPPPIVPPAATDLPFVDVAFLLKPAGPWTAVGQANYTTRTFDFGTGMYFWGGKIKRYIRLNPGRLEIAVDACGYRENDSLTVSINTQVRRMKLIKGTKNSSIVYRHVVGFNMAVGGTFELSIGATNMMARSISGDVYGADNTPPGRINLINIIQK
jgi:hypothetical protein